MEITDAMKHYIVRAIELRIAGAYSPDAIDNVLAVVTHATLKELSRTKESALTLALRLASADAQTRHVDGDKAEEAGGGD